MCLQSTKQTKQNKNKKYEQYINKWKERNKQSR